MTKLLILLALLAPLGAMAEEPAPRNIPPANTLYPLPKVEGVARWESLAAVELDYDGDRLVAIFPDEVAALDGQAVRLVGFLMPLDVAMKRMLLSMISPQCPFCLPGGPGTMVELISDEPFEWTDEAVVVGGTFEIIGDDWNGLFYRMIECEQVAVVPAP